MTYKANNTGDNVARELETSARAEWEAESLTGVQHPGNPPVGESLYLKNNIHSVSVNTINKIGKDSDLTVNAYYIHDKENESGENRTSYFIPGQNPLDIYENIDAENVSDRLQFAVKFTNNSKRNYLNNRLCFDGSWNRSSGTVLGDEEIRQSHRQPKVALSNGFRRIRRYGKWQADFCSDSDYSMVSSELNVSPEVFSVFFEDGQQSGTKQHIQAERFRSDNYVSTSYGAGFWHVYLNTGFNAHAERLNSVLSPSGSSEDMPDSLVNDCAWRRFDVYAEPRLAYMGNGFNMSIACPLTLSLINGSEHYLASPSFHLNRKISYKLKTSLHGAYNTDLGDIYDIYGAYIMRNYRSVSRNDGRRAVTKTRRFGWDVSYSDPLNALFASADVSYFRSDRSKTVNNLYDGGSLVAEVVDRSSISSGLSVSGRASKRFSAIATSAGVNGGWSRSRSETMVQGETTSVTMDSYRAGANINSKIDRYVLTDYSCTYSLYSVSGYNAVEPVGTLKQSGTLNFVIAGNILLNVGAEHYFCGGIEGADRNTIFVNASASYRHKRLEFILEGRNLLDKRSFSAIEYFDTFSYAYTYELRPLSVMFKVRFSLR